MIVVFLGPTLPQAEARKELDAHYFGPAAQGDLYRAVRRGATAVGLIDGFFHSVPSVWHKEVLWALSEGVPVYGSASMGALRAAELWTYGMIGVGSVFEAYRDGILMDDDEVALAHADAEHDYRPMSEPMVDIRATIERAREEHVVAAETADALLASAKSLFYPDRMYPTIMRDARRLVGAQSLEAFARWWSANRVSVKRADAVAMLRRMALDTSAGVSLSAPQFWFECTALWNDLTRQAADWEGRHMTRAAELKEWAATLEVSVSGSARDAALARVLALDEARRQQFQLDEEMLYEAVIDFRLRHGLIEPEDLERWMVEHELDKVGFLRFVTDEARIEWVRAVLAGEIDAMLPDHLRSTDQYRVLRSLATASPDTPSDEAG